MVSAVGLLSFEKKYIKKSQNGKKTVLSEGILALVHYKSERN